MEELLEYDIESIFLNRVRDVFPFHQRIISACDSFFNGVSNSVKKERAQKHDYTKKLETNSARIANISSQIKDVEKESAVIVLEKKIFDKKINNIIEHQEKIIDEIAAAKSQEESYALEIVDLQQEVEEKKLKKQLKWDGIKRALKAYKSALQIHIQIIETSKLFDKIRISFFALKDEDSKFYVDLIQTSDSWRVETIHPSLNTKHEEQLKCLVNYKKHQEVSDITAFLCLLRKLFQNIRKSEQICGN